MSFKNKTVLITGGTKGLGLEMAQTFKSAGARVFVSYRSDQKAAANAESVFGTHPICVDLSEPDGAKRLFDEFEKHADGKLDVYVHNAAATAFKPLTEIQAHHIDKTFNISVKALILGAARAAALMKDSGAILTISGMDTLKCVPGHGLLAAAKSALETLTAYLAHELGPKRIRVNGINPGFFASDSTRRFLGARFEPVEKFFAGLSPMKRSPELKEIARVAAFLCSDEASWIVGQTLVVDGGQDFTFPAR